PQIWNQYHNQIDLYLGLAEQGPRLDILDVGCAQGTLALLLAERGHRVCAMDIRKPFLDYAASRHEHGDVRWVCGNALDTDPGGPFDLIFANQILEHLVVPVAFVGRLAQWLRPGGLLVATTPNGDYVKSGLPSFHDLGDVTQHEHRQFTADGDGHFFAYRPKELHEIFVAAGMEGVHVGYFETPWISGHMKVRFLHGLLPSSVLRRLDQLLLATPGLGHWFAHQLIATGRKSVR
ncbi:MAG TPA: class I SAM-dependent methyltransferase, partial [Candidatus Eisenbacteria bacterium]|nr:class I SAM-dependent methyltransferase [Candidatus Eisenbacteria bacterium]